MTDFFADQMHASYAAGAKPDRSPPVEMRETRVLRARAVHRAASDLKRGVPVLLTGPENLVVLPAETAGARGLREFAALADESGMLLLAPSRAAAVLRRPVADDVATVAIQLTPKLFAPDLFAPERLRGLADPTVAQILPEPPGARTDAPGDADAAMNLLKIARLLPAALVARSFHDTDSRARALALHAVAAADVMDHGRMMATDLVRVAEAPVPLQAAADARIVAFRAPDAGIEHIAILVGRPEASEGPPPLVRVHSECLTGDLFGSLRCDCGLQLHGAIARMADEGAGVLLYLAQEGRGIGFVNKLRAYTLQDRGLDTVDANRALGWAADERDFRVAAAMLDQLGIGTVRLLTNNPDKVATLEACGIVVVRRESLVFAANGVNDIYLGTKAARFGHYLG